MGRLFTYMVKAAAGQQPMPYTGSYGTWDGLYDMGTWETAGHRIRLGGESSPAYKKYLSDRRRHIDNMYNASRSDNVQDWGKLQGAGDYLTALDSDFKDAASVYDTLSGNEKYREAIRQLANTGDWSGLRSIGGKVGRPRGMRSPFVGGRSDYLLADGVGNAQLIMNMYLAEEARRKKSAGEAQQQAPAQQPAQQPAAPQAPQPAAPKPATAPVQAPAIPEGTSAVTGPDGKQYISSNAGRKAQTAAGIGAALEAGQNPFAGARTAAPGAADPTRVNMNAGQDAVRNQINSNITSGQSMYSNMGDTGRFMTDDQRRTMNTATTAAQPYESSGLRMVGHSADGSTQTYVGRSGRGRITVGTDATAGHYRGAGAADANTRSNYKDLRARTARPAQTPAAPAASRKTSNTTR